jgi:hypothetical protein
MMQKSSKFLISDLISDQASVGLYAPKQILNEHDNSNKFLNSQSTAEFLVKSIEINKAQVNINDLIYSQLNEFFIKNKSVPQFSEKEPNVYLNELSQSQRCETHGHNNFCNCIPCQALRFFNMVSNKDLNQFNAHEKISTHNISSSNNFINHNQHLYNNNYNSNNNYEEKTLLNLRDVEEINLRKKASEDELNSKKSENYQESVVLKKSENKILKGMNFCLIYNIYLYFLLVLTNPFAILLEPFTIVL